MMNMTTGSPFQNKPRCSIFKTQAPLAISILRAVLGWIFIKEGTGKLYAWFGGGGPEALAQYFQQLSIPFAKFSAYLVGYTEFFAGVALLIGFLSRPAALSIGIIMLAAIFTAHRHGGYHYPLLILFVCIALLRVGAGRLSLDYLIYKKAQADEKSQ